MSGDRDESGEGGLLDRWAERKRRVADEQQREAAGSSVGEAVADESPESLPPPLTDADMPPLDSLDEGSDYSGFLSPEVSEGLRRAALRKLFSSASFNICDGLDDYAEDFTSFEPLGDVVTWDMRAQQRREAERAAAEAEAIEAESDDGSESGAAAADEAAAGEADFAADDGAADDGAADEGATEADSDHRAAAAGEPLPGSPGDDARGGQA